MRIFIKTRVQNNLRSIHQKFDQNLFEKLSPPLMTVKVERFDGCLKDHEVHLLIQSLIVRNKWISKITTSELNEKVFYFIDEGIEILTGIPAGLPDAEGLYPPESINGKANARLKAMTMKLKKFNTDATPEAQS